MPMSEAERYLASVIGEQALHIAALRQQLAEKQQLCAQLGAEVQDLKEKVSPPSTD